ncbi:MAG: hypothetical protein WC788_04320 [Candidatus Paceibacterota bacterium]|jgi:hypothetical protein
MSEKKRSKKVALIILLFMSSVIGLGSYLMFTTLPETMAVPSWAESNVVKINPGWENLTSYDVSVRPFPWIDTERETIESPISSALFLYKVETGKIEKVRYVIKDHSVKLYGYEPELAYNNISARWDLYSTELAPVPKKPGDGMFFSNPRPTEDGRGIIFDEEYSDIYFGKAMIVIFTTLGGGTTLFLIIKMLSIARDKEFETREEEK